jgi:endoglucanase
MKSNFGWEQKARWVLFPLLLVFLISCATSQIPHQTPADKAALRFRHGVNIANCLEVSPHAHWSVPHTTDDLREMRAEGFDHVRLPVGWHYYTGPAPGYKLSGEIFDKVDYFVTNATSLGLNIIINIHDFNEFMTNPAENTDRFYAIWRQVAAHYAHAPPGVVFELLNEPHDQATTGVMNPIYAETIREIRRTNPHRTLFVEPGNWGNPEELAKLKLPQNDKNIIVSVHCYQPMFFTHQGASWVKQYVNLCGVHFPGPPETPLELDPSVHYEKWVLSDIDQYNNLPPKKNPCSPLAFVPKIQQSAAWGKEHHRPIHFGEFGAFIKADQPSRVRYYAAMRQALNDAGLGWAIWDWKSGFNYWDRRNQRPFPGMHEALFPREKKPVR